MCRDISLLVAVACFALILCGCKDEPTSARSISPPAIKPLPDFSREVQGLSGVLMTVYEFEAYDRTNLTLWLEYEATDGTSGESDLLTRMAFDGRPFRFCLLHDAKRYGGILYPMIRGGGDYVEVATRESPVGVGKGDEEGIAWVMAQPVYVYRREQPHAHAITPTPVQIPKSLDEPFTILTYEMHETVTPRHNASKFTEDTVYVGPKEKTERTITIHVKGKLSKGEPPLVPNTGSDDAEGSGSENNETGVDETE
jgi:hypothetical protein